MTKSEVFNKCTLFIALICAYNMQGLVYEEGSIYSQMFQLSYLLMGVYYYVYALRHYKFPSLLKGINHLLVLFIVYGAFHVLTERAVVIKEFSVVIPSYVYLQRILRSLLPIFVFYVFAKKGYLTRKYLCYAMFIFFAVAITEFFANYWKRIGEAMVFGEVEMTNNMGYTILSLLPGLLLFDKNNVIKYFGLSIILLFVLLSAKRGCILITSICLILFLYREYRSLKRHKWFVYIMIGSVLFLLYYAFNYLMENSYALTHKIQLLEDGNSSGRDDLYNFFWNSFIYDSNLFQMIFGRGANGTIKIYYNYAHNDWLEILTNQGILGILLYVVYWRRFYVTLSKMRKYSEVYTSFLLILVIYFMRSFFSMSYEDMPMYVTVMIGYYCANNYFSDNNYCMK